MIEKVLTVKGVGLLSDAVKKPVDLAKFNLMYGGNGRGKTTFTAILRSLQNNTPSEILQRKTIGTATAQEVRLLIDGKPRTFSAGGWDKPDADLLIFDSEFVDKNVYSGQEVDAEHRKNLHSFAIGEDGVKLAKEVEALAKKIAAANAALTSAEDAVLANAPDRSIGIAKFLTLEALKNPEAEISEKEKYVTALKQAARVARLELPFKLSIPSSVTVKDVKGLLQSTITEVSREAERLVKEHIAAHKVSERWVEEGVASSHRDCPFCGRSATGVLLLKAYSDFFSTAYKEHKSGIERLVHEMATSLSKETFTQLENSVLKNGTTFGGWRPFLEFEDPKLEVGVIAAKAKALLDSISRSLRDKKDHPLEPLTLSEEQEELLGDYADALVAVSQYNTDVENVIAALSSFRTRLTSGDLVQAERSLLELRNRKHRHTSEVTKLCEAYERASKEKQELVDAKDKAKETLDKETESLLGKYKSAITAYISRCGGNFEISDMATAYPGGVARIEYKIRIFGEAIDLTNKKAGLVGFSTAMSQGDRNTLAFAFFLAKLDHSKDLSDKTIVFDDPLSSHDAGRRQFTRSELIKLAKKCKQLIILTHDDETAAKMAREIREDAKAIPDHDRRFWEFRLVGKHTEIHALDPASLAKLPYIRRWEILSNFLEKGSGPEMYLTIVQEVRPCLEDNLKFRFPDVIQPQATLGGIIKAIREAAPTNVLSGLQSKLDVLEQIDRYVVVNSHGDENAARTGLIDAGELRTHVGLAIDFMRGIAERSLSQAK